jgi:hypothetical protein
MNLNSNGSMSPRGNDIYMVNPLVEIRVTVNCTFGGAEKFMFYQKVKRMVNRSPTSSRTEIKTPYVPFEGFRN